MVLEVGVEGRHKSGEDLIQPSNVGRRKKFSQQKGKQRTGILGEDWNW